MNSDHVLWLLIGIAVGWLGIPLVLGLLAGKKAA